MTRESAEAKARRYLSEARLTIVRVADDEVRALARGDGQVYRCGHVPGPRGGWFCTCAARGDCCHLIALRLVIVRRPA